MNLGLNVGYTGKARTPLNFSGAFNRALLVVLSTLAAAVLAAALIVSRDPLLAIANADTDLKVNNAISAAAQYNIGHLDPGPKRTKLANLPLSR